MEKREEIKYVQDGNKFFTRVSENSIVLVNTVASASWLHSVEWTYSMKWSLYIFRMFVQLTQRFCMHHLETLWNAHAYIQNTKANWKFLLSFVKGNRVMLTRFWSSGLAHKNTSSLQHSIDIVHKTETIYSPPKSLPYQHTWVQWLTHSVHVFISIISHLDFTVCDLVYTLSQQCLWPYTVK